MAADAHLRAQLTLDTNVRQAVDDAAKGLEHLKGVAAKARDDILKSVDKGDPIRALARAQQREIAALEKAAKKAPETAELAEKARVAVVEKYARQREEVERKAAEKIAKIASADQLQNRLAEFKAPINDMRGLMSKLGADADSAASQVTHLATGAISAFASGGGVTLAIATVTTAITSMAMAWRDARDQAAEARSEFVRSVEEANGAVNSQRLSVDAEVDRRLAILGGATPEGLQGEALVAGARENQARMRATVSGLEGAPAAAARARAAEIARLERERDAIESRGKDAATQNYRLGTLYAEQAEHEKLLSAARAGLLEATRKLTDAEIAAGRLTDVRSKEDAKKAAEKRAEDARRAALAPVRDLTPGERAALGLAPGEKFGQREIEAGEFDRAAQWKWESEQLPAGWLTDKEIGLAPGEKFGQREIEREELDRQFQWDMAAAQMQAAKDSEKLWAETGISAGGMFAQGIRAALESKKPEDIFGSLIQTAGAIMTLFAPTKLAGGLMGIFGGFFEKGGVPYALHMPQGRDGLAVLPGLNNDAKPAWLHKNEVVMPERVVNDEFGGLPEAAAVAAGRRSLTRASGVTIVQNVTAFDPRSFRQVSEHTVEPAIESRLTHGQGAKLREAVRVAAAPARYR